MQIGEFHTRDGLTFRRNDDGTVRVRAYLPHDFNAPPVLQVTLTAAEWESVVRETAWAALHKRPAEATDVHV